MRNEMPDWVKKERDKYLSTITTSSDLEIACLKIGYGVAYQMLSKPENVAKIDSVKALIDACKMETFDYVDMGTGDSWKRKGFNHDKITEALKPFQEIE